MSFDDTIYCIDTGVLIYSHQNFPESKMPELWEHLSDVLNEGNVISHEAVYGEITGTRRGTGDLEVWVEKHKHIFRPITDIQTTFLPAIFAKFSKLLQPELEREQADAWLIALLLELTKADGLFGTKSRYRLVTTENPASSTRLPAACRHFGLQHCSHFDFFEEVGIKFAVSRTR